MHLCQSSIYAHLGTERLRELYSNGGYGLTFDKVSLDSEPTQPDIYWQFS